MNIIKSAGVLVVHHIKDVPHVLAFHSLKRTKLGLPHGKLNPRESLEQCAVRETLEETGRVVQILPDTPYVGRTEGSRGPFAVTYKAEVISHTKYWETPEGFPLVVTAEDFLKNNAYPEYCKRVLKHFNVI